MDTTHAILLALHSLLSNQSGHAVDVVLANHSPVIAFASEHDLNERALLAVQCLLVATATKLTHNQLQTASEIFTAKLLANDGDELLRAKLLGVSLKGLQNIVEQGGEYVNRELGVLLGVVKCYMVFGLKGVGFVAPQKVAALMLSVPEEAGVSVPHERKGGKVISVGGCACMFGVDCLFCLDCKTAEASERSE